MNRAERYALHKKEEGNAAYREHRFEDALNAWGDGLNALEGIHDTSPLGIALRSNITMVFMKLKQYEYVITDCTGILEADPTNTKILARLATARENIANNNGKRASFDERKELHNLAVADMQKCIDILNSTGQQLDPAREKLRKECQNALERLATYDDEYYTKLAEGSSSSNKKNHMDSGFAEYLSQKLTLLPEHVRIPMASMRYEMLATRLLMSMEQTQTVMKYTDGSTEKLDFREWGKELLNKILTSVAQVPFCLFPATGSSNPCPPITVHRLAFYMRACLSEKALKEWGVEEFCTEATEHVVSDKEVYAIATHGYKEVEDAHNPMHGHGKNLSQSARGPCMPCICRLTREGKDDWGACIQQAAHCGRVESLAYGLNRLLEKIDSGKMLVVDAILETDHAGCNAMMHATNDTQSGLAGLSIWMMIQAASFSTPDPYEKEWVVRKILNKFDSHSFSPALGSCSLMNMPAMEAFVQLGASLLDSKVNGGISEQAKNQVSLACLSVAGNPEVSNMLRALQTKSEESCCSYCGKPEKGLMNCLRCLLAKYCNRDCQKRAYKKHKFVCTSAKVEQDLDWYASNISTPRP